MPSQKFIKDALCVPVNMVPSKYVLLISDHPFHNLKFVFVLIRTSTQIIRKLKDFLSLKMKEAGNVLFFINRNRTFPILPPKVIVSYPSISNIGRDRNTAVSQ